jgi:IS5 family transposase
MVGQTRIGIPSSGETGQTYYQKTKEQKKFRKRAGIEPVIGHLKSDHRIIRNYLRGALGDAFNTLLAAAAYNLRLWMNKLPYSSFVSCLLPLVRQLEKLIFENQQLYPRLHPVLATLAE